MNLIESIAHLGLTDCVPSLTASAQRSDDLIDRMRAGLGEHGADHGMDVFAFDIAGSP
jgi:hypothetical protein